MVATIIVPLSAPNSAQETRLGSQQWIDQGKHWLLILLDRWGELSWIFVCPWVLHLPHQGFFWLV